MFDRDLAWEAIQKRRAVRLGLRQAALEAMRYAEALSAERPKREIRVVLGRGGEVPSTRIHIQGNAVTDYIWEQMAEKGRRFKTLAVFKNGARA